LLFQAVRDTLWTLLADPQYRGAQPGMIAALHTWSQTLVLHPHVHCLVTGGGLTPEGDWKASRNGVLLPARVVMAVFRGQDAGGKRAGVTAGGGAAAGAARAAAVAHPLDPPRPPNADEVERADHGALSPRGGRRDVSGPLPARRPHQERPPRRVGR